MTTLALPREKTDADRVDDRLADVVVRLNDSTLFELVRPGRWRSRKTGNEIETNYVYGEARIRIYPGGGRTVGWSTIIRGRRTDDTREFYRQ